MNGESLPTSEDLVALYDRLMRGAPPVPPAGVTFEWDGPVLRMVGRYRGFVTAPRDTGLRGVKLDQLIARQRDYFAMRGESVEWKTRGHDEPSDLVDRLRAAGFVPDEPETVMIALAHEQAAVEARVPDGVVLRDVTTRADVRRIAQMEAEVWDEDWDWLVDDLCLRVAAHPDRIFITVAEADETVAGALWVLLAPEDDHASLRGAAILPAWRGRGICRALITRHSRYAAAHDLRYLQSDASADSEPVCRGLGFQPVTSTTAYVWSP